MKKLEFKDLEKKSVKELVSLRKEMKKEHFTMKSQLVLGSTKQTHLIKLAKGNVARINTALSSKLKENGDNR